MIRKVYSNLSSKYIKFSILILNYNTLEFLKKNINSIAKQTKKNFEIIIFDNASENDEKNKIKKFLKEKKIKNISLYHSSKNLGYAEGNNKLSRLSIGEYLVFLNSDIYLSRDFIKKINNKIVNKNKCIWGGNMKNFNKKNMLTKDKFMTTDIFLNPTVGKKENYIDGANLIINKNDFFKLGMFDKDYFIYQEDIDISIRALLNGYKLITLKNADYFHYGSGSFLNKNFFYNKIFLTERNNSFNVLKNMSITYILFYLIFYFILFRLLIIIFCLIFFKFKLAFSIFKANLQTISNLKKIFIKRKKVNKIKIKSDLEILKNCRIIPSRITQAINYIFLK